MSWGPGGPQQADPGQQSRRWPAGNPSSQPAAPSPAAFPQIKTAFEGGDIQTPAAPSTAASQEACWQGWPDHEGVG